MCHNCYTSASFLFSFCSISCSSEAKKLCFRMTLMLSSKPVSILFFCMRRYTAVRLHPSFLAIQLTERSCRINSSLMSCPMFTIDHHKKDLSKRRGIATEKLVVIRGLSSLPVMFVWTQRERTYSMPLPIKSPR